MEYGGGDGRGMRREMESRKVLTADVAEIARELESEEEPEAVSELLQSHDET